MNIVDRRNRPLQDLRISVTDRCNFRCKYCMPKEVFNRKYEFLQRGALLSFEEIYRLSRLFNQLGVRKIRLTGGEPLLRRDIETLIRMLSELPGIDLTLTTNGSLPPERTRALKDAGLRRITVSLDALDDATFRAMNDVNFPVARVLEWIEACDAAGLRPVKINMVVKRGINEDSILPMAEHFRGSGHILRFIEFMDVGSSNGWRMDQVVPAREILKRIHEQFPIEPIAPNYSGEVAKRWRYCDGAGEIGVIASVTEAFCSGCTRTRLSADGKLYTCLFATQGHDLKTLLRQGASDEDLLRHFESIWQLRDDRYSEQRSLETVYAPKVEMSYIGG